MSSAIVAAAGAAAGEGAAGATLAASGGFATGAPLAGVALGAGVAGVAGVASVVGFRRWKRRRVEGPGDRDEQDRVGTAVSRIERCAAQLEEYAQIDIEAWEKRFSELEGTVKERENEIKASDKRISELEGTVKEREKENKEFQKRISELEGTGKEREKENKASEKRISELEGTAKEREKKIKASEERIASLEGTAKEREKNIKASEERIASLEGTAKSSVRLPAYSRLLESAQLSSGDTFEWEIKNPVEMKAKHPKIDDYFLSPEFFLRGLGPWKVEIWPSGCWVDPGGVGVFLIGSASTASAKVEGRLTVNGKALELGESAIGKTYWGRPKFPGFAWPASDTEPVRIKVELLKVTNLAVME